MEGFSDAFHKNDSDRLLKQSLVESKEQEITNHYVGREINQSPLDKTITEANLGGSTKNKKAIFYGGSHTDNPDVVFNRGATDSKILIDDGSGIIELESDIDRLSNHFGVRLSEKNDNEDNNLFNERDDSSDDGQYTSLFGKFLVVIGLTCIL